MHIFRKNILIVAATVAVAVLCVSILLPAATDKQEGPYSRLDVFSRALSYIERHHVTALNEDDLIYNAVKGMVRAIDPHSSFLTPEEFTILKEDTTGKFHGVGLEVGIRDDALTVIAPLENSPAEKAGILPGDRIVRIEKEPTRTMNLEGAVQLMRGPAGTRVTITIRRDSVKNEFDVTLIREKIEMQSVSATLLAPGYAHVHVKMFQDRTAHELKKALEQMKVEGGPLAGVVLDLRRNPGGLLAEAVRVADLFMSEGNIVSTRGRDNAVLESFDATRAGSFDDLPMVCLIDAGSASASEIVAGALKDSGRALIVGTRSFGKGSVQSIIPLSHGTGLKLTTALYFTPSGSSIQATGIEPDVLVESLEPPIPDDLTRAMGELPAERDLPGHLKQNNDSTAPSMAAVPADYQLRVAWQILNGLVRSALARESTGH